MTDCKELIRKARGALNAMNKAINEHPLAFHVKKEDFDERVEWCRDNMQGDWVPIDLAGICCIRMKDEKDAMLYKLTWK